MDKTRNIIAILIAFFLFSPFVRADEMSLDQLRVPGTVSGVGKHFEVDDSEYLNVSLDTEVEIDVRLESIPEMIVIELEKSENDSTTELSFSGFEPNTTYYKYEDDYHNYAPIQTDENGVFSFEQELTERHVVFIQPRKSTKFIKDDATGGDCLAIGVWDASSKTCTLTQDVSETIQIDNADTTLDGAGHVLVGFNTGAGVQVQGNNSIIKNLTVKKFSYGIQLSSTENKLESVILQSNYIGTYIRSNKNQIVNSIFDSNNAGISISYGSENIIKNNQLIRNNQSGITISSGVNNSIEGNSINFSGYALSISYDSSRTLVKNNVILNGLFAGYYINGSYNTLTGNSVRDSLSAPMFIYGSYLETNEIDSSNTVDGKPVYYVKNQKDVEFAGQDMGVFYCLSCENVTVKGNTFAKKSRLYLSKTKNSLVENNFPEQTLEIVLDNSTENIVRKNDFYNMRVINSSNNKIYNNNIFSSNPLLYVGSSGNVFYEELPMGGNYWERNKYCQDSNNDGFCDAQLNIGYNLYDKYPFKNVVSHDPVDSSSAPSNVLFLPGIKASRLYKDGALGTEDKLWLPNYFGNDLEELALDEDGNSVNEVYTRDVLDELPNGSNVYKSFMTKLAELKNDGTINDFNLFAYDWRKSVEDVAKNETPYPDGEMKSLISTINSLAENSKSGKVTIVAHSMGGLVTKAAMLELERLGQADKIDKIIFVGTPQLGTPLAMLSLLYGYDEAVLAGTLIAQDESRKFAENLPSAYGLLPSEEYFDRTEDDPFIDFTSERTRYENFLDAYGADIDSVEEFSDFLTGAIDHREKPDDEDVNFENVLREDLLNEAVELHRRLDSWIPPENIQVIQIAGWGLDTVSGVEYTEKEKANCYAYPGSPVPSCVNSGEYEPLYEPKFTVDGDEVVVTPSALMMEERENVEKYWVDLYNYNDTHIVNRSHRDIIEVDSVDELISNIIKNDENINLSEFISDDRPSDYEDAPSRIRMSLYSPLDMHLYDSEGRHTGPKIIEESGQQYKILEEEIPNSYYYQFGERKYVGVPGGEDIRTVLEGYDEGSFTLKMEELRLTENGAETVSHTTFENLPVSAETEVTMNIPENGIEEIENLKTDFDGDGDDDYLVELVPNGTAVLPDMIAPETEIEIGGTGGTNGWYISDVNINLSSVDNEGGSGVGQILYSLDGGESWSEYSQSVTIPQESITNFRYYSKDVAGNQEAEKSVDIKIDKTAPEAKISFDQVGKKLEFSGTENLSGPVSITETEMGSGLSANSKARYFLSRIFDILKKGNKKTSYEVTLIDEAGHETKIVYEKNKDLKRRVDISLKSIAYDGNETSLSTSLVQYKWLLDKKENYFHLGSHIHSGKDVVESHYFAKKNETWIMQLPRELGDGEDDDNATRRPVWKKMSGMVIPYVESNQGKINIKY